MVKLSDPFVGLTGAPQFTGEQVAVAHVPFARHAIVAAERLYPLLQVTEAKAPYVVEVKSKDPFVGLTGVPQLTGEQVAVSHAPLARHAIEFVDLIYPELQVTEANDSKVVVVKLSEPFVGLTGFPQLIGEQVAASQLPLARHAIEEVEPV